MAIPIRNNESFYKDYKLITENPVSLPMFRVIVNGFFKFIAKKVFAGFDVQLSTNHTLGAFGMKGKRVVPSLDENGEIKGAAPNWHESKKLWRKEAENAGISYQEYVNTTELDKRPKIFFLNSHSNYTRYSWKWQRTKMRMTNKLFYSFVLCRTNKRLVSGLVREGQEYYTTTPRNH